MIINHNLSAVYADYPETDTSKFPRLGGEKTSDEPDHDPVGKPNEAPSPTPPKVAPYRAPSSAGSNPDSAAGATNTGISSSANAVDNAFIISPMFIDQIKNINPEINPVQLGIDPRLPWFLLFLFLPATSGNDDPFQPITKAMLEGDTPGTALPPNFFRKPNGQIVSPSGVVIATADQAWKYAKGDPSWTKIHSWAEGSFDDDNDSLLRHYYKHRYDVRAKTPYDYLQKAIAFSKKLKGVKPSKLTDKYTENVWRYRKNGKYIDIGIVDGRIYSFGSQNHED
jgi:hypothetical protein